MVDNNNLGEPVGRMDDLTMATRTQYGVACVWPNSPDQERVNICGSRNSARKYQAKVMARGSEAPLVADVVRRDVLVVYGPWTDADGAT